MAWEHRTAVVDWRRTRGVTSSQGKGRLPTVADRDDNTLAFGITISDSIRTLTALEQEEDPTMNHSQTATTELELVKI
ncbi:hypothetical protein SAMN05444745_109138 [Arthrobacter sp. OV608]|nr:hypothetical protein SAMN05444745_109138 [Arthrobacter sp. OV608]